MQMAPGISPDAIFISRMLLLSSDGNGEIPVLPDDVKRCGVIRDGVELDDHGLGGVRLLNGIHWSAAEVLGLIVLSAPLSGLFIYDEDASVLAGQ